MTTLVDTSALFALLDADDRNHEAAAAAWIELLDADEVITHHYVVIESSALVQRRLGGKAITALHDGLLGPVRQVAVDATLHRLAVQRWRSAPDSRLSLVDATSFTLMAETAIRRAFAFDVDFDRAGFEVVPG